MAVTFEYRDITDAELKQEQAAFATYGAEFGNPKKKQQRHSFVATDNGKFIGCSSGLTDCNYFHLSDLLVEKEHRKQGYGKKLLKLLEKKVKSLGLKHIWTWTAGYEAPDFYKKQGYKVFATFKNWYPSGHARVGLIKKI